jgi:hypothetical protein
MAGKEDQEIMFIETINEAVKKSEDESISVQFVNGSRLNGIVSAEKKERMSTYSAEPYTDVILKSKTGRSWNFSMKDIAGAPSLGGGGSKGIDLIAPGLMRRFYDALLKAYLDAGYKKGDEVPDGYAEIPDRYLHLLIKGTPAMGGPIHYMYTGPKIVLSSFYGNVLNVNGNATTATNFAAKTSLYFRNRRRRGDQPFDPDRKDSLGYPNIYGKSPSSGESGKRLVIVDSMPSNAFTIRLG